MDPVITQLNEIAKKSVGKSVSLPPKPQEGPSSFQSVMDNHLTERLLNKLQESYGGAQNNMTVLSADQVHVQTKNAEFSDKSMNVEEKFFSTFKDLNKDLVSLDSAIETLTTPGLKVSPQQLLALQAGVANTTLMAEGFTRFVDAAAKTIQNLTTQVNV